MAGSDLTTGKLKVKVQDAYSMRSTPQVIGALRDQLAHARRQVEIELIGAAQALDFRDFTPGAGTRAAHAAIRKVVEHLDVDRPLFADHNAMAAAVKRCEVLDAVVAAVGALQGSS